jgi:uncharacterized membrane protein YbhN (UPF0104 family)
MRVIWTWARALGGIGILGVLLWRVGTGPFLDGVRSIDAFALVAAFTVGVATTLCCAWRWSVVAAGLGTRLPLREAVAAYYQSQFLNVTLPGGVLGDVHRAVRHGMRSVVVERVAAQVVQVAIAVVVLAALPSPVRRFMPWVAVIVVVLAGLALYAAGPDIRRGLLGNGKWVAVLVATAVVLGGHLATFVLAARTAGSDAPLKLLMPLTLLALFAMAVPLNVAGWGPREGVAAWAFGAAGLTSTQGVSSAVTYGVLVFIASLPGAGVLLVRWLSRVPEAVRG